jgi:hypothetical protein
MSWLLLAIQVLLGTVLLIAATAKAFQPEDFASALRLSHLPSRLVKSLIVAIPLLESCVALTLVLSTRRTLPVALSAAAALFGMFTLWMIWIHANRLRVRCGCFGPGGTEVGQRSFTRNGLLIVLAAAGVLLAGRTDSPLPAPSLWMVVAVTTVAACLALVVALKEVAPHFAFTFEQLQQRQARADAAGTEE